MWLLKRFLKRLASGKKERYARMILSEENGGTDTSLAFSEKNGKNQKY
jgi:hypothetical protein